MGRTRAVVHMVVVGDIIREVHEDADGEGDIDMVIDLMYGIF